MKLITTFVLFSLFLHAPANQAASKVNKVAPEIGVSDTQGKKWTLKKLEKDKVYFIEFWATWCGICKKIEPTVDAFVKANRGDKFEYLSVSIDEDLGELRAYLQKKKPAYPVLMDPSSEMAKRWKVEAVPMAFFVKNGRILWEKKGEFTRAELDDGLKHAKQ
ncbi:TlpA disulfide reductase family protein [Kamptonema cortianum]|nr:TlpA disulfide reductase family protein [Geitlerinema splendidum]MDK3158714.1 TlpA disulfide reductase family protein [Kamptonema cortianum]